MSNLWKSTETLSSWRGIFNILYSQAKLKNESDYNICKELNNSYKIPSSVIEPYVFTIVERSYDQSLSFYNLAQFIVDMSNDLIPNKQAFDSISIRIMNRIDSSILFERKNKNSINECIVGSNITLSELVNHADSGKSLSEIIQGASPNDIKVVSVGDKVILQIDPSLKSYLYKINSQPKIIQPKFETEKKLIFDFLTINAPFNYRGNVGFYHLLKLFLFECSKNTDFLTTISLHQWVSLSKLYFSFFNISSASKFSISDISILIMLYEIIFENYSNGQLRDGDLTKNLIDHVSLLSISFAEIRKEDTKLPGFATSFYFRISWLHNQLLILFENESNFRIESYSNTLGFLLKDHQSYSLPHIATVVDYSSLLGLSIKMGAVRAVVKAGKHFDVSIAQSLSQSVFEWLLTHNLAESDVSWFSISQQEQNILFNSILEQCTRSHDDIEKMLTFSSLLLYHSAFLISRCSSADYKNPEFGLCLPLQSFAKLLKLLYISTSKYLGVYISNSKQINLSLLVEKNMPLQWNSLFCSNISKMLITLLIYMLPLSFSNIFVENEIIQLIFQNLSIFLYFLNAKESGLKSWFEWMISVHNMLHMNNYCSEFKFFNSNLASLSVSCKKLLPCFSLYISEQILEKSLSKSNIDEREYFMLNASKLVACSYCIPLAWSEELNEEIESTTDDKWTSGSNFYACDRELRLDIFIFALRNLYYRRDKRTKLIDGLVETYKNWYECSIFKKDWDNHTLFHILLHSGKSLSVFGRLGLEFQERDDLSNLLDFIEILDYDFQENEPEIPELEMVDTFIKQVEMADKIELANLPLRLFKFDDSKIMYIFFSFLEIYAHLLSLHFDRESFFTNLSACFTNNSAIISPISSYIVKALESSDLEKNASSSQPTQLLNFPCTLAYSMEFGTFLHKSPLYYEFPSFKEEIVNLKIFARVAKEMLAMSSCLSPLGWHYLALSKMYDMKICLHESSSRRLAFASIKKNALNWTHHYKHAKKYLLFERELLFISSKKSDSLSSIEKIVKLTSKDLAKVPYDRMKSINLDLLVWSSLIIIFNYQSLDLYISNEIHALRAISHINLVSRNEGYSLWTESVPIETLNLDLIDRAKKILNHLKLRIDASCNLDPKLWYFHLLAGSYSCYISDYRAGFPSINTAKQLIKAILEKLKFNSFVANATPTLDNLPTFCIDEINISKSDSDLIYIPLSFCYFYEIFYNIRYLFLKFDLTLKDLSMNALVENLLNYIPVLFLIHKSLYFYSPCKILLANVLKILALHYKKINCTENKESYLMCMFNSDNLRASSLLNLAQKILEPCILDPKSTKVTLSLCKNRGLVEFSNPSNNTELQFEFEQSIQYLISHENFRFRTEDAFHELYHIYLELLMLQKNWSGILKQSIVKVVDEEFDDLIMHRIYSRFLLFSSLLANRFNIDNFPDQLFYSKCFEMITEMVDKQLFQHPELIFIPYLITNKITSTGVNFIESLYDSPFFHLVFKPHLQISSQNFSYLKLKDFQLPTISNDAISTAISSFASKNKNLGILTCYNIEFTDMDTATWDKAMEWNLERYAKTRKLRDAAKLIKEPYSYYNNIQIID